jgi:hypothetical protein
MYGIKPTALLIALLALLACHREKEKTHLPSQVYHLAKVDTAALADKHMVYVPVYSHIYTEDGTSTINLNATLSVRNTSFTDSLYVTDVAYYDSQGKLLKRYLNSTLVLRPMSSVEFVVERTESAGGAGANFVVRWGSQQPGIQPLIQSVMIGTAQGISFLAAGVEMKAPSP